MESNTASDTVTVPRPSTEARNVTEQTSKHEHATQDIVQVNQYTTRTLLDYADMRDHFEVKCLRTAEKRC